MKKTFLPLLVLVSCSSKNDGYSQRDPSSDNSQTVRFEAASIDLLKSDKLEDHMNHSRKVTAFRLGVEIEALDAFYASVKNEGGQITTGDCVDILDDTISMRSEFLRCLARKGRTGLDEELYRKLTFLRFMKLQYSYEDSFSIHQTLGLVSLLSDMVLVNLQLTNPSKALNWYSPPSFNSEEAKIIGGQFLNGKNFYDFPFEDGDIVIGIGGSSISTMIPLVTYPERRYSHSFMMRVRNGKTTVVEALIEKGVIETDWKAFTKHGYKHMTVMRLPAEIKDVYTKELRAKLIEKASDIAHELAKKGMPYNIKMDPNSEDDYFCSQLVLHAYLKAYRETVVTPIDRNAPLEFEKAMNSYGTIVSPGAKKFLKIIGVSTDRMPAPGDLLSSNIAQVVSDYKNIDQAFDNWTGLMAAHNFLERLDSGAEVELKYLRDDIGNFISAVGFHNNVPGEGVNIIIAYQKMIYEPSIEAAKEALRVSRLSEVKVDPKAVVQRGSKNDKPVYNLLNSPIWEIRGQISHKMATVKSSRSRIVWK